MAERLFVTSVANLTAYDQDDNVVLTGRSLLDTSLKTGLSKTEIRGGKGNALLMNYWHTSMLDITIQNPEWSLPYIAAAVGSQLVTGTNVYTEETITLVAHSGTVTNTPLAVNAIVYGWVLLADQVTWERVIFTGSTFTTVGGGATDTVCVKYFYLDPAAKSITISSNIIPSTLRVVLEAQLVSNTNSSTAVGSVEIIVPKLILNGVTDIAMKANGVAQGNLAGTALAFTPPANAGCVQADTYAYINQVRYNTFWYSDLSALAIVGGDFALTNPATKTLGVRAIHSDGSVSTPPMADLTFSSSDVSKGTVGLHTGIFTTVAAGTTEVHVYPTNAVQFDAYATATIS